MNSLDAFWTFKQDCKTYATAAGNFWLLLAGAKMRRIYRPASYRPITGQVESEQGIFGPLMEEEGAENTDSITSMDWLI